MTHSGSFLTKRSSEDVFDLVANPERFTPLLPNFESMVTQDATHFTMRIAIAVGQINGHANLAMELQEAVRPSHVEYRGNGIVAGSQVNLGIQFQVVAAAESTEVTWRGEVTLDGMLALMAGDFIETMGRSNFDLMAERLQNSLRKEASGSPAEPPPG
jgi:carbon monoxide dehydrogenase subunit G